jgi:hypothetical protein
MTRRKSKKRGYRDTLRFMIANDADMTDTDNPEELFGNMSIAVVAYMTGVDEHKVCADIVRLAKKMERE